MEINLVLNNVRVEEVKSKVVDIVDQIEKGSLLKVANVTVNVIEDVATENEKELSIFNLLECESANGNIFARTACTLNIAHVFGLHSILELKMALLDGKSDNDLVYEKETYSRLSELIPLLEKWDRRKNILPNLPDCENDSFSSLKIPPNVTIADLLRVSERDSLSEDSKLVTSLMSAGIDTVGQIHSTMVLLRKETFSDYPRCASILGCMSKEDEEHLEKLITAWAKRFL